MPTALCCLDLTPSSLELCESFLLHPTGEDTEAQDRPALKPPQELAPLPLQEPSFRHGPQAGDGCPPHRHLSLVLKETNFHTK